MTAAMICTEASAYTGIVQMRQSFDYKGMARGVESRKFVICDNCPEREPLKAAVRKKPLVFPLAIKVTIPPEKESPVDKQGINHTKPVNKTTEAKKEETKQELNRKAPEKTLSNENVTNEPVKKKEEKKYVINFDFNSSYLNAPAKVKLMKYIDKLKGKEVRVVGYTDSFGSKRYNDWLALRRAKRVASVLKKYKINVTEVKGLGKCCYIGKDSDNRRVEIMVVNNDTNLKKGGSL